MKVFYFSLLVIALFANCKKDKNQVFEEYNSPAIYNGDGFIYTDGDPSVVADGLGWYYAESRVGDWNAFPIAGSELASEFKNITVNDSIAVTVHLVKTQNAVGCECIPGKYFFYNVKSIKKR